VGHQNQEGHRLWPNFAWRVQQALSELDALAARSASSSEQNGPPWPTRAGAEEQRRNLIIDHHYADAARPAIESIREALAQIGAANARPLRGWDKNAKLRQGQEPSEGGVWTLGLVVYRIECRVFLRGELELRNSQPIDVPDAAVQYLVSIPGTRDRLTREIHGHWGYHYHYLDKDARRSDTLLTFDRASKNLAVPTLCWERHGEGGFCAKASRWGIPKRRSVYSVCRPDTQRFALTDFKRPGADAQPVWP